MNLLLLLLLQLLLLPVFRTFSLNTDGVLLLSFKFSILNDPLHVLDTWTVYDDTPCNWRGVVCGPVYPWSEDTGRVIEVSLPGSQLLGTIPANFGQLDRLQTLDLSSNSINGSIPDTLFRVRTLRVLDVSGNFISGEVVDSVGELRSLSVFNVSDNALGGNIPQNLGNLPNLTAVILRDNYFTGELPSGFDRIRVMDLSSNLFNGSLPGNFGGNSVRFLNVSYNRLKGEIPSEFGRNFPENVTLDFSYNNLTGKIPDSSVFLNQEKDFFAGNLDLCGPPLSDPCRDPLSPTGQPIPPPAIAAIPKDLASSPDSGPHGPHQQNRQNGKNHGLRPRTIVWIVLGDVGGIVILCMILFYIYKRKTKNTITIPKKTANSNTIPLSLSPLSSSDSKGITRWACLRKRMSNEDEDEDETDDDIGSVSTVGESREHPQEKGQLVTVDGENELELETLLKASAYILGTSGSSIMYKAVMEDGTVWAVRRVGESGSVERFKEFESHVRSIAKMAHPNLVRVKGFYWASDEKLVIFEYVPGGSLANARYRKTGSSPCHIPWEVRLRIAKGVARGLSYLHDKKQVHGNLKSTNILLDLDMEPKIADFGLEKLTTGKSGYLPGVSTRHFGSKRSTASRDSFQDYSVGATPSPSSSSIGGVSPYHPPESLRSLKPNSKWDVYSYGVLLLELLTGKVIVSDELGPPVLPGLAGGLEDRTKVLRMADPAIRVDLEGKEEELLSCLKLGYNCVSHAPQKRPTMKEVVHVIEKISASAITLSSYHYGP